MIKVKEVGPLTYFDGVFEDKEIEKLDTWFAGYQHWGLGYDMQEYGASSATLCKSVKFNQWVGLHAILGDAQNIMRTRIERQTDYKVPPFQRCLINNFKFGDSPMWHKDSPGNDKSSTWMVYPNRVWELNWGGYTAFADDEDDVIACANAKPGRVVMFNGKLNHCGVAPTKVHKGYGRFSIAYQDPTGDFNPDSRQPVKPEDVEALSLVNVYGENYFRL